MERISFKFPQRRILILFKERGVPGVYGVDTRELTRIIREYGVMNAMITDDLSKVDYEKLNEYRVKMRLKV